MLEQVQFCVGVGLSAEQLTGSAAVDLVIVCYFCLFASDQKHAL